MFAAVSRNLDAGDPFLRCDEFIRIPQVKLLPFFAGKLVGIVPEISLDGDGRFFERFVILADSEMLVSFGFVVIGEDRQVVGRLTPAGSIFSLKYSQTMKPRSAVQAQVICEGTEAAWL